MLCCACKYGCAENLSNEKIILALDGLPGCGWLGRLRLMRRPWPGTARVSSQVQSRKQDGEVSVFPSPEAEPRLGTSPDRGFSYALLLILSQLRFGNETDFATKVTIFPASGKRSDAGTKNPAGEGGAGVID